MLLLLPLLALFRLAEGTFFSTSVVFTSQDFVNDPNTLNYQLSLLKRGIQHRVYAVYANSYHSDDYMSGVQLTGANAGVIVPPKLNVSGLSKPLHDSTLDGTRLLTTPITFADINPPPAGGRPPYTIYIVSVEVLLYEVISAQLADGVVRCDVPEKAPGCTVLSAEMAFQISGSGGGVFITPSGFDDVVSGREAVTTATGVTNTLIVSGPIATIHTLEDSSVAKGGLQFSVKRNTPWNENLEAGAVTSLLSNGWFRVGETYSMPYDNSFVRSRTITYPRDVEVTFAAVLGNYYPDKGDSVMVNCLRSDKSSTMHNAIDMISADVVDICNTVSLQVTTKDKFGPQFKVDVASGVSTSALLAAIVLTLWRGLA